MHRISKPAGAAIVWLIVFAPALSVADVTVYNLDLLRNALNGATPGARINVAPGIYDGRLWVSGVHGTPEAMIEVVALNPADRPVFRNGGESCFTLCDSSYVLVDGIIAEAAGTPTSSGNNIEYTFSHHMILKNSISRDIVHQGNSDGVKFVGANDILMYNCTVEDWGFHGSGVDIVGCRESLIARSYFNFPGLGSDSTANCIQPKGGSYKMGFYKNRFDDASCRAQQFGGSTGDAYWHQGNRDYGWEGYEMVSMGNAFADGEAAVAYVSCTDCTFAYNTIVDPDKWVMRILKEGGDHPTAGNTFAHNLIKYGDVYDVQNIGSNTDPASFTYAEDYWYKWTDPASSIPSLPGGETNPAGGTDPDLDADYKPRYGPAKAYGAHAPAMEGEFAQSQEWFQWAWDKAQQFEPNADAGGRYMIALGGTILLDGGGSYGGVGSYGEHTVTGWQWDLDGDGAFDRSGQVVEVGYDELIQMGLGLGTHTIELKVTSATEYGDLADWGFSELELLLHPDVGDANVDGSVDGADYTIWADHYGASGVSAWSAGGWAVGNFNEDAIVDGADYTLWADNYTGSGLGLPEPSTLWLLGTAAAGLCRRRRQ